jgi:hypothetical protein
MCLLLQTPFPTLRYVECRNIIAARFLLANVGKFFGSPVLVWLQSEKRQVSASVIGVGSYEGCAGHRTTHKASAVMQSDALILPQRKVRSRFTRKPFGAPQKTGRLADTRFKNRLGAALSRLC